jgi:hypothetical protein
MVSSLIIWTYIIIFSYIYGWTIVDGIGRLFSITTDFGRFSKPLIILTGLCGINTFVAFLSLFMNLGWQAQTIFLLLGLILGWRMWNRHIDLPSIKPALIPWWLWTFGLLVFLTVLEYGTHAPLNPDTGIYHAQTIRWIETFPVVPGLGNLEGRLAYNSNWLVINAFFSFSFLGIRSFHVLPGAFVLVALFYFMEGTYKLFREKVTVVNGIKTLLIPLVFYLLRTQISSPGTDFPVTIWIWITFLIWLDSAEKLIEPRKRTISLEEILIFIFPIYLVTIKLSASPLLLFSVFILIRHTPGKISTAIKLSILALIVLSPWLTRNLILSGYWVYPIPMLSVFSPNWDWKIPLNRVVQEQRVNQAWARIPGENPDAVMAMPLLNWLRVWFQNHTINQRSLVLGAVFSPIIFLVSSLLFHHKFPVFRYFSYAYLFSYCGFAFWLLTAPDIRFGFGFIIITLLLSASPLGFWILDKVPLQKSLIFFMMSLIVVYQAFVLYHSIRFSSLVERVILPEDYNGLPTSPCDIHGFTLLCADYYDECWYGPFPCIPPGSANSQVELRGETLQSGFRVTNLP